MMLCSQARESLKNIPNPSLRPDLTTPYAKPYLWTPVPYARMFFSVEFVAFRPSSLLHLGKSESESESSQNELAYSGKS